MITKKQVLAAIELIEQYKEQNKLLIENNIDNMNVSELNLSIRAQNVLKSNSINTVGDILSIPAYEWGSMMNMGRKTSAEIEETLQELGVQFKVKWI